MKASEHYSGQKVKGRLKWTVTLCHAGRNKESVSLVLHVKFLPLSPARIQQKAKQAKLKERRQRTKEKKAAAIGIAKAKEDAKVAEMEVVQPPADADEPRPSKRLKATSNNATMGVINQPNKFPQARSRKARTDDGTMSA